MICASSDPKRWQKTADGQILSAAVPWIVRVLETKKTPFSRWRTALDGRSGDYWMTVAPEGVAVSSIPLSVEVPCQIVPVVFDPK
jgi:hypothetical protein